jgi:PAS domain S-box-containing protein
MMIDLGKNSLKILEAIRQPILVIDRDYRIIAANSAACGKFSSSPNDIIGKYCFQTTHQLQRPCWQNGEIQCPAKTAFELRRQTSIIHRHSNADKTVFEEIVASPIFDDHGEMLFVVEELRDITALINAKEINDYLREEIETLRGILPICSSCKKIRDDKGYWEQVDIYIHDRTGVDFSHSICPACFKKLYPGFPDKRQT